MRSAGPCCVSLSRASGRASVARGALHRRSLCVSSSRLCGARKRRSIASEAKAMYDAAKRRWSPLQSTARTWRM